MILIFSILRFSYFNIPETKSGINEYQVIEVKSNYTILERKNIKYLYYQEGLKEGNSLLINSKISLLEKSDFNDYLKTQRVYYLLEGNVICNDNYTRFNTKFIDRLLVDKDASNKSILKLILFNQKDDSNEEFYQYFDLFSISFLLVVSGFHINILFKLLKRRIILKYIVTFFYLYLLDFSISSYRAFFYFILKKFSKNNDLVFNNSDILSLILIAFLFINPSFCFSLGFICSFAFSYIIDFLNNVFYQNKFSNKIIKKLIIYACSIPIILLNNYELNTSSLLVGIIFIYPVSFLFVFSFVYLFLDKFYLIYKLYLYLLKLLLDFFANYSLNLVFGKPSLSVVILLYLFILLGCYFYQNKLYKKMSLSFMSFFFVLLVQYNLPYMSNKEVVYFLNVGQGDCSVLKIKNSKKVVLIDAPSNIYRDLANDKIIPFLKSKGINEIDKIVISHDDIDHSGSLDALKENFRVNKVIDSSLIKEVYVGDSKFINLNVNESRDNDGSIVLYGEYGNIKYLFTGDISSKKEEEIIEKYKINVDVLKVSHHGSNNSSSKDFLRMIGGKIAIISVSKNNLYKHPDYRVIKRLSDLGYIIFRTDLDDDIIVYKSLISDKIIIEKE